jgi:cation transport regulator ChaB
MPMTTKTGKPIVEELPSTIQRSDPKAQRTFAKAHDAAVEEYGEGERAHRVAYAALKHTHEKVGDRWKPKGRKGPSDEQAKGGRATRRKTAQGVDAKASKEHMARIARELDIAGRSKMTKSELVKAIQQANARATRRVR